MTGVNAMIRLFALLAEYKVAARAGHHIRVRVEYERGLTEGTRTVGYVRHPVESSL